MSKKKIAAMVTAIALSLALLVGGAFAWTDFSQSFINRFRGGVSPDALLHDDFEPWVNKDVYVENTGEQDILVRVKFNEFLQIGNVSILGGEADDKTTWPTHTFVSAYPIYCDMESHDYFRWEMNGDSKFYLKGTSEFGNEVYTEDQVGEIGPNGQMIDETLPANRIVFMWEYEIISQKVAAGDSLEWWEEDIKDIYEEGCWIVDEDGWAYWSRLLNPGYATNLLLNNVELRQKPDDNFYYAIDVIMEAANKTEAYKFDGTTPGADALIKEIVAEPARALFVKSILIDITDVRTSELSGIFKMPEVFLSPVVSTNSIKSLEFTMITPDQEIVEIDPVSGKITLAKYEDDYTEETGTVTVKATATLDDGRTVSGNFKVTVYKADRVE